jgi:hypothetical protein
MQPNLRRRWTRRAGAGAALLLLVGAALVLNGRAADRPAWRRWRDRLALASVLARSALARHPVSAPPTPLSSPMSPGAPLAVEPLPMVMKPIITAPSGRAWLTKMRDQLCRCTEIECARTLQENYARSIGPVDLSGVDPNETSRLIHEASDCTARLLSGTAPPPLEEAGG